MLSDHDSSLFLLDRQSVADIRMRVEKRFYSGITGIQTVSYFSELTDRFLQGILERFTQELGHKTGQALRQTCAIIAVGGYGRGELSPYSDIDLLFLKKHSVNLEFDELTAKIVQRTWDSGFKLGHSLHSLSEVIFSAKKDLHLATSLIQTRLLWGSESLHHQLSHRFSRSVIFSRSRQFIEECVMTRKAEWIEKGSVIHPLEPDVKESYGCLRDMHLLSWVGYAMHGQTQFDTLMMMGVLSKEDAHKLRDTYHMLTHLRVDLHLHGGKAQDILTKDDQQRITKEYGASTSSPLKPVEQFMQVYFQETQDVAHIVEQFVEQYRQPPLYKRIFSFLVSRRVEKYYMVSPHTIDVVSNFEETVYNSLELILKLFELAVKYKVLPTRKTLKRIKQHLVTNCDAITPQAARSFMAILHTHHQIGDLIWMLYESEVLFRMIPEFEHIRGLIQFNHYHHYAVDEHTLRAIEAAEEFSEADNAIGNAYLTMKDREYLHLAILLHDIGKGRKEDHSIVGAKIAEDVGARLFLPQEKTDQLSTLVLKHLNMTDQALRRDINDPKVVIEFSKEIGDSDTLTKLFVLSAVDLTAVGPNVFTEWKGEFLTGLYQQCIEHLKGVPIIIHVDAQRAHLREQVKTSPIWEQLSEKQHHDFYSFLQTATDQYLFATPIHLMMDDFLVVSRMDGEEIYVDSRLHDNTNSIEYRVVMKEKRSRRVFQNITGTLTAFRMEIINADINVFPNGMVFNRFYVMDRDFTGASFKDRTTKISEEIKGSLQKPLSVEKLFKRNRRYTSKPQLEPISGLPLRVVIDNTSSELFTIIEVFAHDRPGLLYTVAKTLEQIEVSVSLAKIATHFDQSFDVFYVVDRNNLKIVDPLILKSVREGLEKRLLEFTNIGYKLFLN